MRSVELSVETPELINCLFFFLVENGGFEVGRTFRDFSIFADCWQMISRLTRQKLTRILKVTMKKKYSSSLFGYSGVFTLIIYVQWSLRCTKIPALQLPRHLFLKKNRSLNDWFTWFLSIPPSCNSASPCSWNVMIIKATKMLTKKNGNTTK